MSPRTPLRWRLRDATADAHARLDARLECAFDDVDGYAAFLRGMHRFALATCAATAGDPVLEASARELALDLSDLDVAALSPVTLDAQPAVEALGWRYVAAGASLGARVLLPRAVALGFDAGHGARYLSGQAGGSHWRNFLATLDAVPADDADAACDGARAAFALAEASFNDAFEALPA